MVRDIDIYPIDLSGARRRFLALWKFITWADLISPSSQAPGVGGEKWKSWDYPRSAVQIVMRHFSKLTF